MKRIFILSIIVLYCLSSNAQTYTLDKDTIKINQTLSIVLKNSLNDSVKRLNESIGVLNQIITNNNTAYKNENIKLNSIIDNVIEKANYYVSPKGDDNNPGSIELPFKSIEKAYSVVVAGDLVYFRGGYYYSLTPSSQQAIKLIGKSGTKDKVIRFWAFPGEHPVINLSNLSYYGTGKIDGITFTGDYWHWKGFEIIGFPFKKCDVVQQSFFLKDCNYCIFEQCNVHDNYSMGIVISGKSNGNILLNCDGYRNYDKNTTIQPGGNADGIHITVSDSLSTNYVIGCRAWDNSDDGFDYFNTVGMIITRDCWAFHNGYIPGTDSVANDGNGIKLGQVPKNIGVKREVSNCISAYNKGMGIDQNVIEPNTVGAYIINCKSFNNGSFGIRMNKGTDQSIIINNSVYGNKYGYGFNQNTIQINNISNKPINITISDLLKPR